eukprot:scaffold7358_cov252-Pinguiococcus_pyrenoidosus.AAC.35
MNLRQGSQERPGFRLRDEVEVLRLFDSHGEQQKHHRTQITPLNLGRVRRPQLAERGLGVQPQAHPILRPPGAAAPLLRRRLGDGLDAQRVHSRGRVVSPDLPEAAVHHRFDAGDGDARLGDVRREDHLARVRRRSGKGGCLALWS